MRGPFDDDNSIFDDHLTRARDDLDDVILSGHTHGVTVQSAYTDAMSRKLSRQIDADILSQIIRSEPLLTDYHYGQSIYGRPEYREAQRMRNQIAKLQLDVLTYATSPIFVVDTGITIQHTGVPPLNLTPAMTASAAADAIQPLLQQATFERQPYGINVEPRNEPAKELARLAREGKRAEHAAGFTNTPTNWYGAAEAIRSLQASIRILEKNVKEKDESLSRAWRSAEDARALNTRAADVLGRKGGESLAQAAARVVAERDDAQKARAELFAPLADAITRDSDVRKVLGAYGTDEATVDAAQRVQRELAHARGDKLATDIRGALGGYGSQGQLLRDAVASVVKRMEGAETFNSKVRDALKAGVFEGTVEAAKRVVGERDSEKRRADSHYDSYTSAVSRLRDLERRTSNAVNELSPPKAMQGCSPQYATSFGLDMASKPDQSAWRYYHLNQWAPSPTAPKVTFKRPPSASDALRSGYINRFGY